MKAPTPAHDGRLIAIGDIHGCVDALEALLEALQLGQNDALITLGDYVDRGPDSRQVLDLLIELYDAKRVIPLRGNHELMMMRARDSQADERFWRNYGGDEALASYATKERPGRLSDVPQRHWQFMATDCCDYVQTEDHIFVHAGVNKVLPLDEQIEEDLFWQLLADRGPHCSGKTVICGHTTQHSGMPRNLGHTICIDTGAYCGGWLTALDVRSLDYWQTTEFNEFRSGTLARL